MESPQPVISVLDLLVPKLELGNALIPELCFAAGYSRHHSNHGSRRRPFCAEDYRQCSGALTHRA